MGVVIDDENSSQKRIPKVYTHTAHSHPQNIVDTSLCDIAMVSRTSQECSGDMELSQPSDVAMLLLQYFAVQQLQYLAMLQL